MIKSEELKKYLEFAYSAYQENNVTNQAYRQDGNVPYITHPLWCASMLIADTQVPYEQRELGFKALILHDVLEDTSLELPEWVDPAVKKIVQEMTFENWEQAKEEIPKHSNFLKLLHTVDALSSMYENHVSEQKRTEWKNITAGLLQEIEREYGNIRIVQIGNAVINNTNW